MIQDRPVLRLSCDKWSVDVTAGKTWHVGIGLDCEVPLPLSGPTEPWFVIRHAGVWSARSIDDYTRLTLNRHGQATDRGVRIGDQPVQELHAQRGDLDITLRIVNPTRTLEPAASILRHPDETVAVAGVPKPSEPDAPRPLRNPHHFQSRDGGSGRNTSGQKVSPVGQPWAAITEDPLAQMLSRVEGVPSFLDLMAKHRWPGRLTVLASPAGARPVRDHAVLLTRALKVGRSSHHLLPADPTLLEGPVAPTTLTVFDLLRNRAGRFPAGRITDQGLLLTTSGTLMHWQRALERSRELLLSAPPPISGQLQARVSTAELPEPELLLLLVRTARRLLSGTP
jgi:hypothetical protein